MGGINKPQHNRKQKQKKPKPGGSQRKKIKTDSETPSPGLKHSRILIVLLQVREQRTREVMQAGDTHSEAFMLPFFFPA